MTVACPTCTPKFHCCHLPSTAKIMYKQLNVITYNSCQKYDPIFFKYSILKIKPYDGMRCHDQFSGGAACSYRYCSNLFFFVDSITVIFRSISSIL